MHAYLQLDVFAMFLYNGINLNGVSRSTLKYVVLGEVAIVTDFV